MTRFVPWLLLTLLLGGYVVVAGYVVRSRAAAGKGMPPYSVFSEERDGLAEAAAFVRKLGWEPVALTRPVQHTRHRGLLVVVEPGTEAELGEADALGLLRWVEQGNTLLLFGRHVTALHSALAVDVLTDDVAADAATVARPGAGLGYTAGMDRVILEGQDSVTADAGLPLWQAGDKPGAVLVRRGRGRVLVVADPSLLTRRGLTRGDNFLFLVNVAALHARDGRVHFDEYHHGLRSGGGVLAYLRFHNRHWVLVPLLVLAGAAAWASAVRLGPAVVKPGGDRTDAVDYASAVARIYQRAGVSHLLARTLARGFVSSLVRYLRLQPKALPAEILAAWQRRHAGASSRRLQALLGGVAALRREGVGERQLLYWTRAFGAFEHEVLRGR